MTPSVRNDFSVLFINELEEAGLPLLEPARSIVTNILHRIARPIFWIADDPEVAYSSVDELICDAEMIYGPGECRVSCGMVFGAIDVEIPDTGMEGVTFDEDEMECPDVDHAAIERLLERAVEAVKSMTPEEYAEMQRQQALSFARSMRESGDA